MTAATFPRATLPSTPEAMTTALKDMIQGDGWALLCEMVEAQYGSSAVEREITAALFEVSPGDHEGQRAVVGQILKGAQKAREVLTLPQSKIQALTQVPKREPSPMDKHRNRVSW